jgi:virginiamycin B lyase
MRRKAMLGVALLLTVPIALVNAFDAIPASAVTPPVDATGTVSCTSATGLLKFAPALTNSGASIETAAVKVTLGGCTATGSNVTSVGFTGKAKGSFSWSTNNCSALSGPNPVSGALDVKWSGKAGTAKLNPTTVALTTVTGFGSGQNGDVGISFANQAASGSFPSPLQAEFDTNENVQTASGPTGCGSRKGLKKLVIVAGDVSSSSQPVISHYTDPSIALSTIAGAGIALGSDGALWFTNSGSGFSCGNSIGRITTVGTVTSYTGTGIYGPVAITPGPDGALWFTNFCNSSIGRITTSGVVSNYTGTGISSPDAITAGPDGALWFTNFGNNSIGRITTSGVVSNYTDPTISLEAFDAGIAAGSDGALWFTNNGNGSIGRITTSGAITKYTGTGIRAPSHITAGPDGALWFTNNGVSVGRITTSGVSSEFPISNLCGPGGITTGPDGAIWFTQDNSVNGCSGKPNFVDRLTTGGNLTEYVDPSINGPRGVAPGPDDAVWFTNDGNNSIGRIRVN